MRARERIVQADAPCISKEESGLAPHQCSGLCLLHTDVGIGSDLVRVLLDFLLVASLETVGVRTVGVVLIGGDIGVLLAFLGIGITLDRDVRWTLRLTEETHSEVR